MPSHVSVEQILSESFDSQDASLYAFGMDENEKLFLDESEQSYNTIVNAITNYCVNKIPDDMSIIGPATVPCTVQCSS